jgi:hypothetical protein
MYFSSIFPENSLIKHLSACCIELLNTSMKQNYSIVTVTEFHVTWFLCHHGMERPQVADGEDGLQKWRVAANILNKQSRSR